MLVLYVQKCVKRTIYAQFRRKINILIGQLYILIIDEPFFICTDVLDNCGITQTTLWKLIKHFIYLYLHYIQNNC